MFRDGGGYLFGDVRRQFGVGVSELYENFCYVSAI